MKLLALAAVGIFGAVVIYRVVQKLRTEDAVSDAWLLEQQVRADRMGVDLPRWRFPRELEELQQRERMRARFTQRRQEKVS